jgi:tRNA (adenine22-N1)-methyltransferase
MIRKRLLAIAELINKDDKIIDIGCDHALLDIYLCLKNKCKNVIATDINKKALDNAKRNIAKYNLDDKIKLILSDGLANIELKDSDTIIISGMGTKTILGILKDKQQYEQVKKIIIQI